MAADYEFITSENEHMRKMKREDHERRMEVRRETSKNMATIGVILIMLFIFGGGLWMIHEDTTYVAPPNPVELECLRGGGTWAGLNGGTPTCLRIEGINPNG